MNVEGRAMAKIYSLAKFVQEKQFDTEFRASRMYVNRLKWFRELGGRYGGDQYKGVTLLQVD